VLGQGMEVERVTRSGVWSEVGADKRCEGGCREGEALVVVDEHPI
jgi:hypothetical protein